MSTLRFRATPRDRATKCPHCGHEGTVRYFDQMFQCCDCGEVDRERERRSRPPRRKE